MHKFKLFAVLFLIIFTLSFQVAAQSSTTNVQNKKNQSATLIETPVKYTQHPEYGKTRLSNPEMQNSIELIHERTIDSRLFKNLDGSFTIVKSGEPMHYKDDDGWWRTINVAFEQSPNNSEIYCLNKQPKPVAFNTRTAQIEIKLNKQNNSLKYGNELTLIQTNHNGQIISEEGIGQIIAEIDRVKPIAYINNLFTGIDMKIDFDFSFLKSEYIISSSQLINPDAGWLSIREKVKVPNGWTLQYDKENGEMIAGNWQGEIILKNNTGETEAKFLKPLYFDSGSDRNTNHIIGSYKLEQIDSETYFFYLMVPTAWLLAPERVYPVTLDPMSIIDDPTIIHSCFYPVYYASDLSVNVMACANVTNTYLLWQFTAIGNAWMEDQRSYVSGINGSTNIFNGTGTSAGTCTYTTNSTIGNSISNGSVIYTFYTSRLWGGSGCNSDYSYLSRRRIEVTYNPFILNNIIGDAQTICHSDIPAMLTGSTPTGGTGNYDYTWMQSTDGGQTWINAPLPNTNINYSPSALSTSTCYKRMVQSDTCISWSNVICITVQSSLAPGTIAAHQTICYNTAPALLTGTAAGCGSPPYTYQWEWQTGCSGGWVNISGANDSVYQPPALTQTTCYRRKVSDLSNTANSNTIIITVNAQLNGGSIASDQTICENSSPAPFSNISSPTGGSGTFSYQWQEQAGCSGSWSDILGAIESTYNQTASLTHTTCYRRQETNNCGTTYSNIISVNVITCTGLNILQNEDIHIYPNPASDFLIIETHTHTDEFIISLYDIRGLLLNKIKTTETKTQVNIADLANGMYFIRLENNRFILIKRFVKKE